MPFGWGPNWNGSDQGKPNNNGATQDQIIAVLATATRDGTGDPGLLQALSTQSDQVSIEKGIHQEAVNQNPHITAMYLGGTWHVDLKTTAAQGPGGYRVQKVSQWRG